ncbi:MAG: hypothetical protein WB019_01225 [Pseudolabrys sp.]
MLFDDACCCLWSCCEPSFGGRPSAEGAYLHTAGATPVTWTCYIGGNVGGAFGDASASFPGGEVSTNGSGFAGGGQIGCDYQFTGGWVVDIRNMYD